MYQGATYKPLVTLKEDTDLSKDGFVVNHARVLVGSGIDTYERGKDALLNWRSVIVCFYLLKPYLAQRSEVVTKLLLQAFWVELGIC